MSKSEKKKQNYKIETITDIDTIRESINLMFDETNNIFKGKFVGNLKGDSFSGHTNYSTHIDVKGRITGEKEKTTIDLIINDCSPDYKTITNTFFIVFLCLSLLIIAVNKVTDIIVYLIPIVIFGLGYLGIIVKRYIFKSFKPKLSDIAEKFAKDVDGKIINIG
ncbi:hypothetical protein [uncultured Tenacibaculum sp.]|uniref:hypothetical protein n=1 Tax=uncultured Tenacibaculum sp. TaxID=174713 RepID=UPI002620E0AB|nr:hypothetical protein [uncultured Tenacibaculum sp.]